MPLVLKELRARADPPMMLPQDFPHHFMPQPPQQQPPMQMQAGPGMAQAPPAPQPQPTKQLTQPHNINHSLYKTELCRSFEETRTCRYGACCCGRGWATEGRADPED